MAKKENQTVYSTDPDPEPEPQEPEQTPRDPAAPFAVQGNQPVKVHLERKGRRGKAVSVLKGVMSPALGKEALLKHLKSNLGTGGAVKGETLEIQGDQRDRIVELLEELGYRAQSVGG